MSSDAVRVRPAAALDGVPGLVAGITLRDSDRGGPDDFGLTTGGSSWRVAERYAGLAEGLGFSAAAVARQVHGATVVSADRAPAAGLWIPGEADGFVGRVTGRLFVVTVADCVPIYIVDPESRAFALLHAGWRGAAAGILDVALDRLPREYGRPVEAFRMHLGPAICGDCYEVGAEVPRAFGRDPVRDAAGRITFDLRAELEKRALSRGVESSRITVSDLCTRCDRARLHSHRGAADRAGRMAAYLGWNA